MLQITTNISVDFYSKKYILVNAKQSDKNSRFLSVTLYYQGQLVSINSGEHSAYIRYKKPNNKSVFNSCDIDRKGKIIIKLTEQMLASNGVCTADLVIVSKGDTQVDTETGEIIGIESSSILSTMPIYIDVTDTTLESSSIESSYEFDGLNVALEKAEAEYTEVMKTSKSWAVGGTGVRDGENTDNSKYWANQSKISENKANTSATNAANSEANANEYMGNALTYSQNAETYMNNANTYMNNAKTSEQNAKAYMDNTNDSKGKTEEYMNITKSYMNNAESSKTTAESYRDEAEEYMNNAAVSASNAANNEANVSTYYQRIQSIVNGLETGFIPMGTVSFSELETAERTTGCVYNIRDDFTTNENFAEGSGMSYTAGTNVYVRSDGLFDCFGGSSPVTATVNEVKQYLNIN